MERLTEKQGDHYYYPYCFEKCGVKCCNDCEFQMEICDKLGKYEDAEEEGRLLILPCKPGDTVYYYREISDEILSYFVDQIVIDYDADSPNRYITYNAVCDDGDYGGIDFIYDDIGKTVFLTKEAAEQALKEMEG